jgi:hypothetical protein
VVVNGALGGQTADRWLDLNALAWSEAAARISQRKATAQQVQVVWIKQVITNAGDFPGKALELQQALETIVHNLHSVYPNLKIVYLSSRTRSYLYGFGLSPEPAAYESGFAVKWLIEKQIDGDPELNFDPARGDVKAPYLAWGPYLWIDGETPRADGRVWLAEDLATDCTHPTRSGVNKVAEMLMEFFRSDSTAVSWFLAGGAPAVQPATQVARTTQATPTATATVAPTAAPTQAPSPTLSPEPPQASPTAAPQQPGEPDADPTQTTAPLVAPTQAAAPTQPPAAEPAPGAPLNGALLWLGPVVLALAVVVVVGVMRRGRRG